jgi:hypothetical protein
MDCQPEHGRQIIQIDSPYMGHYPMGMRDYYQRGTFEDLLKYCLDYDIPNPDFWWMYAEDFPFPDKMDLTK